VLVALLAEGDLMFNAPLFQVSGNVHSFHEQVQAPCAVTRRIWKALNGESLADSFINDVFLSHNLTLFHCSELIPEKFQPEVIPNAERNPSFYLQSERMSFGSEFFIG
jgi:hypothetical protein